MKLTYWAQIAISCAIVLLANVASTVFQHWIYRSLGFVICGFLWSLHPVLPKKANASSKILPWVRVAGAVLVLIGLFTRVNY